MARDTLIDVAAVAAIKQVGEAVKKSDYYERLFNTFINQANDALLELDKNINSENKPSVYQLAHKLKGSATVLGAIQVANFCDDLQLLANDSDFSINSAQELLSQLRHSVSVTTAEVGKMTTPATTSISFA